VFRQHPATGDPREKRVNPFWEESLEGLIGLIGADRVCFGSDYPHAEGLEEPLSWIDEMPPLEPSAVQRIVSANMYELLSLQPAK
jgi:predicted TIM-barrel fold metal-dependent hydrolase